MFTASKWTQPSTVKMTNRIKMDNQLTPQVFSQPPVLLKQRLLDHPVTNGSDHDPFCKLQLRTCGAGMLCKYSDKRAVPAIQSLFKWNRGVNTCGYLTDVLANCHSFGQIWDSRGQPDFKSVKLLTATIIPHYESSVSFRLLLATPYVQQTWWELLSETQELSGRLLSLVSTWRICTEKQGHLDCVYLACGIAIVHQL